MPRSRTQIADADLDFDPPTTPTGDEVRAHLRGVFDSSDFVVPVRLRQFLSYVVEETLAGRRDRIKAYSIATEVFGRDANFDILNDPVVRIEAGRLRRALERYYLLEGRHTPIVIDIPKGGYAPAFGWRSEAPPVPALPSAPLADARIDPPAIADRERPWKSPRRRLVACAAALAFFSLCIAYLIVGYTPSAGAIPSSSGSVSILVKPLRNLSPAPEAHAFAASLSEELISELAQISNLTVFGSEAAEVLPDTSSPVIRQVNGSSFVLEGGIRSANGNTRVTTRLLDGEGAILWSDAYDADLKENRAFDLETSMAAKIAASAASAALVRSRGLSEPSSERR